MATCSHAALLLHVYSFQRSGLVFTFCALQPNKVYIGGLPENTRQEDLQSCFGKIGSIVNIELKYVSQSYCDNSQPDSLPPELGMVLW